MKTLKDEANLAVAQRCQLRFFHPTHLNALQVVSTGGRAVEQADHIHQRALARTTRPDDGDIFALLDGERDAPQRMDFVRPHAIALGHLRNVDHRLWLLICVCLRFHGLPRSVQNLL